MSVLGEAGLLTCSAAALASFGVAAITDLRWRRIGNSTVIVVVVAWVMAVLVASLDTRAEGAGRRFEVLAHLGVGAAAFASMLLFYRLGWVGGGDVKLAGAVVLWSGPTLVPLVMVLVGLGGLFLALVMLALRPLHRRRGEVAASGGAAGFLDARRGVPYGIPLALAGAVVVTAPWLSNLWR